MSAKLRELMLLDQRDAMVRNLGEMRIFLEETMEKLRKSPDTTGGGCAIDHLNLRLFMQVHVVNVLEQSNRYDHAVRDYLQAREDDRKLADAGVVGDNKKGN